MYAGIAGNSVAILRKTEKKDTKSKYVQYHNMYVVVPVVAFGTTSTIEEQASEEATRMLQGYSPNYWNCFHAIHSIL
jgi:hypothetical protein